MYLSVSFTVYFSLTEQIFSTDDSLWVLGEPFLWGLEMQRRRSQSEEQSPVFDLTMESRFRQAKKYNNKEQTSQTEEKQGCKDNPGGQV